MVYGVSNGSEIREQLMLEGSHFGARVVELS